MKSFLLLAASMGIAASASAGLTACNDSEQSGTLSDDGQPASAEAAGKLEIGLYFFCQFDVGASDKLRGVSSMIIAPTFLEREIRYSVTVTTYRAVFPSIRLVKDERTGMSPETYLDGNGILLTGGSGGDIFRHDAVSIVKRPNGTVEASIQGLEAPWYNCKSMVGRYEP